MRKITSILMLMLALCGAGHTQVRFARDFSADFVSESGGHETTARYYASQGRTRNEIVHNGVVTSVMILDPQNHTAWELRPQHKLAVDMSAVVANVQASASQNLLTGAPPDPSNPCAPLRAYTCRKLGNEDVNGRHTQKWEMKDTEHGNVMTVWIDPSLPWAIKTQSSSFTAEFRNLKEGPQPASLFQVPPDYSKSAFPSGVTR
jgi:hypothetical protein